ncbi:MAG: nitroreductase [Bacteroidales bacterium]|nr:nitroreductase [Bacteroidales bacterium]
MELIEAISVRHAVRQYIDKPLADDVKQQLKECISRYNAEGGLHMQLVTDDPNAFDSGLAKYGKFEGVSNYVAMICRKGCDEVLGYYGEYVVLLAQALGLNSCWVGLTFKKQPDRYVVASDEHLVCVLALGYGRTQGVPHPQKKGIEAYMEDVRSEKNQPLPEWFQKGLEAALLAPTAINQQKFEFLLHDDNVVEPRTKFTLLSNYAAIDLGIAKCHFEIGAGRDNFRFLR